MDCRDCSYFKNADPDDEHVREDVENDFSFLHYFNKPDYVCSYSDERIPISFTDGGPSRLSSLNLKHYDGKIGCENYSENNLEKSV